VRKAPSPPYDESFFDAIDKSSTDSAAVVAPLVFELLHPSSVLDVGCGHGFWLQAFKRLGVDAVQGVDGPYAFGTKLVIAPEEFLAHDLRTPLGLHKEFDLALCLEVIEHLPLKAGVRLVEEICTLAPAVLFSAAVPGQGGRDHIDEQPPWFWRQCFANSGFLRFDALRPHLIGDHRVAWWYRQNLLLFVRQDVAQQIPGLLDSQHSRDLAELDVIHTTILESLFSFRGLLRQLPKALKRALLRRIHLRRPPKMDRGSIGGG
jgi:SAM-dependent methyltransferase